MDFYKNVQEIELIYIISRHTIKYIRICRNIILSFLFDYMYLFFSLLFELPGFFRFYKEMASRNERQWRRGKKCSIDHLSWFL